jgi:hypothetical protein
VIMSGNIAVFRHGNVAQLRKIRSESNINQTLIK